MRKQTRELDIRNSSVEKIREIWKMEGNGAKTLRGKNRKQRSVMELTE